jgi:preprotein translocase subunit SecE
MESLVLYVKDSYNELVHKVTWPSWPSLLSSTRLVLVASVIIALIIFVMDLIFNGVLLQNLYKIKF